MFWIYEVQIIRVTEKCSLQIPILWHNVSSCFSQILGPNAANIHIIADLYAEVLGVLAQSR